MENVFILFGFILALLFAFQLSQFLVLLVVYIADATVFMLARLGGVFYHFQAFHIVFGRLSSVERHFLGLIRPVHLNPKVVVSLLPA